MEKRTQLTVGVNGIKKKNKETKKIKLWVVCIFDPYAGFDLRKLPMRVYVGFSVHRGPNGCRRPNRFATQTGPDPRRGRQACTN